MKSKIRETVGRAIHENYRRSRVNSTDENDPSIAEWEKLPEYMRESNRQQADDVFKKLRRIGCSVKDVTDRSIKQMEFTKDDIETMSEMEHERWNAERFKDGWKLGRTKDVVQKISPYLVPWKDLPENVKEWDREAVIKIPEILARVGLEIRRDDEKP